METLHFSADPVFMAHRGIQITHEKSDNIKDIYMNTMITDLTSDQVERLMEMYIDSIDFKGDEITLDIELIEKMYEFFTTLATYQRKLRKIRSHYHVYDKINKVYYGHDFAEHARMLYTVLVTSHFKRGNDITKEYIKEYARKYFSFGMNTNQESMLEDVAKYVMNTFLFNHDNTEYYGLKRYKYSKLKVDDQQRIDYVLRGKS